MLFTQAEMEARAASARALMSDAGVDLIIADSCEFLAWITGFTVSETMYRAAFLPANGEPFVILRDLDADNCREQSWISDVIGYPDTALPHAVMADVLKEKGFGKARIGVDANSYGYSALTAARLQTLLPDATFVDLGEFGHDLRACKSPAELAYLEKAALIADHAMQAVFEASFEGMTTRNAASTAASLYILEGAETGEVGPIVKSAGEQAFLHGQLSDDKLRPSDVLHVELIPRVANYCSRMMRPIVIGEASAEQKHIADRLIALQDEQIAAMKTGALASDVDAVIREPMLKEGLREAYTNVTAYSLGLVSRTPRTSDFVKCFLPTSNWPLETGMVFHVYTSAKGLGFSETVVVTPEGGRRLTQTPRKILETGDKS